MTNNSIDVIVRFRVKPGKIGLYKQAMDFVLSTAEASEPYVLEYSTYKNGEGVYTQYERYADEAALHRHLEVTMDGQIKWIVRLHGSRVEEMVSSRISSMAALADDPWPNEFTACSRGTSRK